MAGQPSSREHMPIQIGLPAEPAWQFAEVEPTTFVAFLVGEELPDPGDAFLAAQRAFGKEPQEVEPLPLEAPEIAWAFSFGVPGREMPVVVWCERVARGATPDGLVPDARWAIAVQSVVDGARAVDDAVALGATAAGSGGARAALLFDALQRAAYAPEDFREIFLGEVDGALARGELADESLLYRVELVARDPAQGPYWLHTTGLARLGRPELELLEIPASLVAPAVALLESLAGRFIDDEPPHAGVPFEAGAGLRVALVPALEAIETLSPDAAGGVEDRARRGLGGPRAAVCAAGKRGSYRAVWVPPLEELARLGAGTAGITMPPRTVVVSERRARLHWPRFVRAAGRERAPGVRFEVKLGRPAIASAGEEPREHRWYEFLEGGATGGKARALPSDAQASAQAQPEEFAFSLDELTDWRVLGLRADLPEIGPGSSRFLEAP
jgi:hypothetical protein